MSLGRGASVVLAVATIVILATLALLLTDWFRHDVPTHEVTDDEPPQLVEVAAGFDQPVFLLNGTYVVEQGGTVRGLAGGLWLDISDRVLRGGERGLLGAAVRGDTLYLHYTGREGGTVLSRMPIDGMPDAEQETVLLEADQPFANHNGGMIAFGPDGFLYMGLGDGGSAGDPEGNGQDRSTILGAILRLDVSGDKAVGAPGNPFEEGGGDDRIWAYGLRNPWRFSFDRATGDLWIGDVGQNGIEEIDRLAADDGGANLGWVHFEGSQRYRPGEAEGHMGPVTEYDHDGGHCSVTGGYVWRHDDAGPYDGHYIFGDYCSGWIWRHDPESGRTQRVMDTGLRISSFSEGDDGMLYVIDHGGKVYRMAAT